MPSSSPRNAWVEAAYTRSPPSSWAEETRNVIGYVGHGWPAGRSSGGRAMISSWVIEAACWRIAVPRQSAPVSPPPMITTCLPSARIWSPSPDGTGSSPSEARLDCGRNSIAWWMPVSSRPSIGSSRPTVDPTASTIAS